jgi:hypothetical protein
VKDDTEISSGALCRLLGITREALSGLVKQDIAIRGDKRGSYRLATVTRYCAHMREQDARDSTVRS